MHRRRFLSVVGVALFAGCSQSSDGASDATATDTATPTSTATPTTTATPTETPTESDTPTQTETDTPTETESPTETPEPTPEPVDRELTEAADHIQSALTKYMPPTRLVDASLKDKAPTDDIQNQEIYEARDLINSVENEFLSGEQQARLKRLQNAYWFVWWLGPTHNAIRKLYQQRPGRDGSGYQDFWDAISPAEEELERLMNESDASGIEVLPDYSSEEYEAVVDRFDSLIADSGELADVAEQIQSAEGTYNEAMTQHKNERYHVAIETFNKAASAFDDVADTITDLDVADEYEDLQGAMECYTTTMSVRSEDYIEAAEYGDEGEHDRRVVVEETATDPEEECG